LDLSESTETSVPHGSSHNNVGGSKTPDAKHVVFCSFPLMLSGADAEHVTVTVSPTAPFTDPAALWSESGTSNGVHWFASHMVAAAGAHVPSVPHVVVCGIPPRPNPAKQFTTRTSPTTPDATFSPSELGTGASAHGVGSHTNILSSAG